MRIKFTGEEIEDLIEFLEQICDPCTDQEVKQREQIISKFRRAQSYSRAGKSKIRYLREAAWKKENEVRAEARESFAVALRNSK